MLLSSLFQRFTTPPERIPASQVRSYLLNNYIITFVFCGHILFTPVYYLLGDNFCFYNNLLCICIDILSLWLNSAGRLRAVYVFFCSAISYHTFVSQVTFGTDSGFVFYFPALAVFIFIFREYRFLRFGMFIMILTLFAGQYVILHFAPSYYSYSVIPAWLIFFINAGASIFGIAFIATFFSRSADRAEALLVDAKERAEEGRRAKSLFLANMSHEIRTPLNSVMGMITLSLAAAEDRERREYLHIAKDSADHLLTVINDILDYSKIEENKMILHYENFDLRHLVANTVKALEMGILKGDVNISYHIAEDIPQILNGDSSRIRQVLNNLLSNAIKFTERGSIRLEAVKLSENGDLCVLEFSVSDTGIGISAERIDAIFDSFVQVAGDGNTRLKGTGLGLMISKELVELMGGAIRAESRPGEGSTFSFDIPLRKGEKRETASVPDSAEGTADSGKGVRVLVAEDDMINGLLIRQYLEKLGCSSRIVINGIMAFEELENSEYDIVFMDIEMPDMNGIKALNLIRTMGRGLNRDVPVIAMTGYMAGDVTGVDSGLGFSGYLSKPFSLRELEEKILEHTYTGER